MSISPSPIYRSDHIMGLADSELTVEQFRCWGIALGRMIDKNLRFAVTCDFRKYSDIFKAALIEGLVSEGIHVADLGTVPTGLASFACEYLNFGGYANVTGGNRPALWNGLVWNSENCSIPIPEQVRLLQTEAEQSVPEKNKIPEKKIAADFVQKYDITQDWFALIQTVWHDTPRVPIKIVIDTMNGNWSPLAARTVQSVYPQIEVESIRNIIKADFGGLIPNSKLHKSIIPLRNEVIRRQADLGIAFDNDAGLFTVVDSQGVPLISDEIAWLFLHDLLGDALENEFFLHDLNCSEKVVDEGKRWGGKPVLVSNNNDSFLREMKRTNALIGIRSDGTINFRGVHGNRIGMFAVCWFLDYLAQLKMPLLEWRATIPSFFTTSEFRVPLVALDEVAKRLAALWKTAPEETIDGIRFVVPTGRAQIRSISDYLQLGFYFEASNRRELFHLVRDCSQCLADLENIGFFLEEQFQSEIESRGLT